jgi:hypothetical protein
MDSGKPPRPVETVAGIQQCNVFCFGVSTPTGNRFLCCLEIMHRIRGHDYSSVIRKL